LAGVSVGVAHIGAGIALWALALTAALIVCVIIFIRKSVYSCLKND
jgi:hypothetical protein